MIAKACPGSADAQGADFLIIPGCRVEGDKPGEELENRIEAAAEYLKMNPHTVAIASGGIMHPESQSVSEAQAIAARLTELGIDTQRIKLDEEARTTLQNLVNSKCLMPDGCKKIAVVSSSYHLCRIRLLARRAGLNVKTVGARTPRKVKSFARELVVFLPSLAEKYTR